MSTKEYGPTLPISKEIHETKYRSKGESFKEAMTRVADALKDNEEHYQKFREILLEQRFLPAGRIQAAIGSPRSVTPYNCYLSGTIEDSFDSIMDRAKEAATTMRLGGGIGYDFSTIRPRGDLIASLDSKSSGPISFMDIFNSVCGTVSSAGHRRGAQMGVLRVDHPDIEEFIRSKNNSNRLTNFNISVGVTDKFMEAVKSDSNFDLVFNNKVYKTVRARYLWDELMRSTWDWAEPGVLFIDKMNRKNNLWYCEKIAATNPCGEQPLPPYGACLLGSFNLVKYVKLNCDYDVVPTGIEYNTFDFESFKHDIEPVVRAMDNVVDVAIYPLKQQEIEAKSKRRMGLGVTGLANAGEALGYPYGSPEFLDFTESVLKVLRDTAYRSSISLAVEKGPFPLFKTEYLESEFAQSLPEDIRRDIAMYGIRNSHLLSIAPTGTISLSADNISSGIEPVFSHKYTRTIITFDGVKEEEVEDYGLRVFGRMGLSSGSVTVDSHVKVLTTASRYVDSACSKTCNVGAGVTWDQFKDIYMQAWEGGASGCTTFRAEGKRFGVLKANAAEEVVEAEEPQEDTFVDEGAACYIDPSTGLRSCE